jgi:post-segregation antitoxin (ccd killing protein)
MMVTVSVRKVTISLDPDLYAAAKADAERKGMTVSSWVSEAMADKIRQQAWDEYMAAYEAEFGAFTDEELAQPLPIAYVSGKKQAS